MKNSSKEDETSEYESVTGEAEFTNNKKRRKRVDGFEEWGGYMAAKKSKLENQFNTRKTSDLDVEQSAIFHGVSIYVNGYTNPPAEELKQLMLIHGGTYHYYYSHSKTTHIVASNLPYNKIKNLRNEIVVKAAWITESVKAGNLLPSHDYLLYPPETKDKQKKLCFNRLSPTKPLESYTINENSNDTVQTEVLISSDTENESSAPIFESLDESLMEINYEHSDMNKPTHSSCISNVTELQKYKAPLHAGHPDFLTEFYSHSRLHHISTAGQELKRYVQYLSENKTDFPGREKLKNLIVKQEGRRKNAELVVMHLDMDCFFVSVGLREHPELQCLPVAVTHSKGKRGGAQEGSDAQYEASYYKNISEKKLKGLIDFDEEDDNNNDFGERQNKIPINSKEYGSLSEIASCNYEARKAGLRNGMFLGEALRLCPNLKTIQYDFESYNEVSKQLYDIVSSYTLEIEAVSVDELYIDCTELLYSTGVSPYQFSTILRDEILEKTKCTASAGIGPNMLLARLATKVAKPNGQYHVTNEESEEFMKKQSVEDLPGVGYRTTKKLQHVGVSNCAELQNMSLLKLQQEFGPKLGESLFKKCRGKDNRTVQVQKDRKSVSAEINYGIRFETKDDINNFINQLSIEVQNRLQHINCKGKLITLKLMVRRPEAPIETAKFMGHGACDNVSKSIGLKSATNCAKLISSECCTLAHSMKIKPQDYRGVGIQVNKLEPVQKESSHKTLKNFFNPNNDNSSKSGNVNKTNTFSPKKSKTATKSPPEKNIIKHLLSKPSKKLNYDLADYVPEQLDQSVLNALPEDLKKEVLQNCAKPSTSHEATSSKCSFNKSPPSTPVSSKKFVQKKLSDTSSTNFNSFSLKSTIESPVIPSSKKNCDKKMLPNKRQELNKSSNYSNSNNKRIIEFFVTWGQNENKPIKPVKEASLGGAVEIDDIRKLLKEWICNTQSPLEEDIEEFKQFLLDSVDQDISKVSLLLKYFYRLANSHSIIWKETYLSILSYVQQKMLQNFGAMLSANSDFPT